MGRANFTEGAFENKSIWFSKELKTKLFWKQNLLFRAATQLIHQHAIGQKRHRPFHDFADAIATALIPFP